MKKVTILILFVAVILASNLQAQTTGIVRKVKILCATQRELEEYVPELGEWVLRSDGDPRDVRIGDGSTTGGWSLWNTCCITSLSGKVDGDLDMDGHILRLNHFYSIHASGQILSILDAGGVNPVFQITGTEAAGGSRFITDSSTVITPTSIVVMVNHLENTGDVGVETCTNLVEPVWTPIEVQSEQLNATTTRITLPAPEGNDAMMFYRLTTTTLAVAARFSVDLFEREKRVLTDATINEPHSVEATNGTLQITIAPPPEPPSEEWFFYTTNVAQSAYTLPTNSQADIINVVISDPDDAVGEVIFPIGWLPAERKTVHVRYVSAGPPYQFLLGTNAFASAESAHILCEYIPQWQRWLCNALVCGSFQSNYRFFNPATGTLGDTPYE